MKELTEAAAWRKLAEWCGTGKPERRTYLCDRLSGLFDGADSYSPKNADPLPDGLPRVKMHKRMMTHNPSGYQSLVADDSGNMYDFRHASKGNHPRVIFCLLMAIECEEELSTF